MGDDKVREEIAFIRSALEQGRAYAHLRSPDFALWGALMALGYLGTYAFVVRLWTLSPSVIWWSLVAVGWLFSLFGGRLRLRPEGRAASPAIDALRALWLGFGVTTVIFAIMQTVGGIEGEWMDTRVAGLLGLCFFASASITKIRWLRFIAAGWWGAAVVFFLLHGRAESLLAGAGFMIVLLCLPGLVLWLRRPAAHG